MSDTEAGPNTDPGPHPGGTVGKFFSNLGPGLISGAADDDPSGISTYSVAGAAFGYLPLWMALFCFPLMASVQLMCARLGLVTGRGLAGVIRRYYPRWVLWGACLLLIVANVFNIGADLGGMAAATALVTGVKAFFWTPIYTAVIILALIFSSYRLIARIFKWLTLVLFSYILTAFLARPDWGAVLRATFFPQVVWSGAFLATFVGILGTTISPYLFFWQASQEVDEERAQGRTTVAKRKGATDEELRNTRTDVLIGMFFANLVMYFIILTTAATLHAHAITDIQTPQQAAQALRPLAGPWAYLLFTFGIIGTGMLAVPVLAGSAAYAITEAEKWRGSLESRPNVGKRFYAVVVVSMLLGLALDFVGFNAIKMLFYSAVLNGVLAPPLVVLITLSTSNPDVMGKRVSPPLLRYLGWGTAAIMAVAAIGMFLTL
jgi:NRAMP (natural resistance-associated macrophage protein)-like metal ion transporter